MAPHRSDEKPKHKRDDAYWRNKTLTPEQRLAEFRARERERRRIRQEYESFMARIEANDEQSHAD